MLIGEYQHNIDNKGRIFIPARFREDLGEHFIITKGLDNCLYAYSSDEWKKLEDKIGSLPIFNSRDLQRFFFAGAMDVEADKQGRVVISSSLRLYAGLTKDVTVIGVRDHAELWDSEAWAKQCSGITSQTIAQAMKELGV